MEFSADATGLATSLTDGDILRIYPIVPSYRKTITLRGDVANPGRFGWHEGMHLSDLIPDKDSLLSRDYWWKRAQLGLPGPEFEPIINQLGKRKICPVRPRTTNTAPGATNQSTPTTTAQTQQQSNSSLQTTQEPGYGEQDIPGYTNQPISGYGSTEELGCPNLYTSGNNSQDPTASGQDSGSSNTDPQQDYSGSNGDSTDPGMADHSRSGSIASQSSRMPIPGGAGQPRKNDVRLAAPDINWDYAVIERLDPNNFKSSLVPFDLGKLVLDHDASQNLLLEAGDTITVFSHADIRVPLDRQTKYVHLEGEFVHSGIYSVEPGETLRDLVRRAGGLTNKAYLYGSEFTRESTRILQQQRLDEYVRSVDLEAQRGTLALTASAITTSPNTSAAIDAARELVTRLKQIRATGRVVIDVHPNSAGIDDIPAIGLEDGDRFTIPSTPATINVVGAVYDQNSFLYKPGLLTAQYLKKAGGPDRDADYHHSFLIRADGSVVSRASESKNLWTSNGFNALHVYPGDTIVVPEKTLHPTALRGLLDWSNIFGQLALGAAAIQVLK
jgi:protein involved in polysaccharide export with SLBB domain